MTSAAEKLAFADAAARLTAARSPRTRERRRFARMPVVVSGRMLDRTGREHDCRTADISPGDVRLASPVLPEVNEPVVLYLEGFGRIAGRVARRCGEAEVAIIFETSNHKREKMAEALTWSVNKEPLGLVEADRPVASVAGDNPRTNARIETELGEVINGEIVDFSLAGITIRTPKQPPLIGAWVRAGGIYGRVARYVEGGFAIDFEPRGAPPRTFHQIHTE
mgnify:FL=1